MYDLEACRDLAVAIVSRAVRDIQSQDQELRRKAIDFVESKEATTWCDALGVEVDLLRDALRVRTPNWEAP